MRLRFLALAFAGVFAVAIATAAQTADEVLQAARKTYSESGPKAALPQYETALKMFRDARDQRGEAITLGLIGNCYKGLGEYPRALEFLQQALQMKQSLADMPEVGRTLSHLGLLFWQMGDYPKALDHFNRSLELARQIKDQKLEAAVLNNMSLVYDEQGDYHRSLEQYQRALELHRAVKYEPGEGDALGNIGGVYLLLGQFRKGAEYYKQSLAISERLNLRPKATVDLGNLALCYLGMGDVPQSLATFDRAIAVAREAGLQREEADWHKGKGSALLQTGIYDGARAEYDESAAVYRAAGMKRELVEALQDSGQLHLSLGDLDTAEKRFTEAIRLAQDIGNTRGITATRMALGGLEWKRQRFDRAVALFSEALASASKQGEKDLEISLLIALALTYRDLGDMPEATKAADTAIESARTADIPLLQAQALYASAEAARKSDKAEAAVTLYESGEKIAQAVGNTESLWQLAFGRGQALELLHRDEEALTAYRQAVDVIESVRGRLHEERFRAGYLQDKRQVYIALVQLLLKLRRTGDAFQFAERLRARSYLEMVDQGTLAGDPRVVELRARIRRLQREAEEEDNKAAGQRRGQAQQVFATELSEAERAYQALLDELGARAAKGRRSTVPVVPPVAELQARLAADEALIEYVVGDDNLSVFVIRADRIEAGTVAVSASDLRARVELLRSLLPHSDRDWEAPALKLRAVLLGIAESSGWLEGARTLVFVPNNVLNYVPFAALPLRTHGRTRFLAEDYVISFLPSAALFAAGRAARPPGNLLALAPASAHLRFAGEEAQSITRYFRGDRTALIGPRATESAFKRSAERYQVIHLATHGFFNKFNPMFSGVQLERDRENDGRLEVHEILGLRLRARLVTLSACETALGSGYFSEFPVGDDFVGLTQAFLSAGTDSVLSSLWQVDDRSSMELIRAFYARIPHQDLATALANAQRHAIRSGGLFSHPYHWAGFVLIGLGSGKDFLRKKPEGIRVSTSGVARPSVEAAER